MANKFREALSNDTARTFNGAETLRTTGSAVLNFFKAIGQRGADLSKEFDAAVQEDKALAFRSLLYTRDIRGGAGEREVFRKILLSLERDRPDDLEKILGYVPTYGRWDDLLIFKSYRIQKAAASIIKAALQDGNGLCAKWMPRQGKEAARLRSLLGWTPKRYRKTLVTLTQVVESAMCARRWDEIVYDHVPSVAAARYQKAFFKHNPEAYKAYRDGLTKVNPDTGKTERKINATAVFPYDVIKSLRHGDAGVASAQWDALKNYLPEDANVLPLIDCSQSMDSWNHYGQRAAPKSGVSPLDVAVSLGLYVADKQSGDFKDLILQFASTPKLQKLSGNLANKYRQVLGSRYAGSTNVSAAYAEILSFAQTHRIPAGDMPRVLLIVSDMEFNQTCAADYRTIAIRNTSFDDVGRQFAQAGYKLPQIVFWNVNGRGDNNPVSAHENGAALVSGFSPSIFKSVMSGDLEGYTPYNVMVKTLEVPRYDIPGLTV